MSVQFRSVTLVTTCQALDIHLVVEPDCRSGSGEFDPRQGRLLTEDIRLDEETVLKTAGADTASGFESLVFRFVAIRSKQ